jgi:SAM-dependent methyltransferase
VTDDESDPGSRPLAATAATYDAVAEAYERRHRDRSVVADQVERFCEVVRAGGRILDAGCGPGWETATFAELGFDPVAVDLTPSFCARTRERVPAAAVARADMRALPLAAGTVEGVWACASFLHVRQADAPGTLAEFARVLRPGGALALSVKRGEGTVVGDGYDGDRRRFTLYEPDDLRSLLSAAGFSLVELEADEPDGDPDAWVTALARLED